MPEKAVLPLKSFDFSARQCVPFYSFAFSPHLDPVCRFIITSHAQSNIGLTAVRNSRLRWGTFGNPVAVQGSIPKFHTQQDISEATLCLTLYS